MTENPFEFGRAVTNGINTGLTKREVLNEYHLESSALIIFWCGL